MGLPALGGFVYLSVVEGEEDGVGDVHGVAGVAVFRHKGVHGSRTGRLPATIPQINKHRVAKLNTADSL